jgi:hypothetical protein
VARSGPWRRRAGAAAWGGVWRRTPCRRWGRLRKGQALGEDMGSVAPRPWWCQYRGSFPHPCLRWWTAPIAAAARAWSRHRTCALAVSTPPWTKPNRRAQTAKSVSPIIGWRDVLGREALLQLNVHLCDVVEANRLMAGAWRHLPTRLGQRHRGGPRCRFLHPEVAQYGRTWCRMLVSSGCTPVWCITVHMVSLLSVYLSLLVSLFSVYFNLSWSNDIREGLPGEFSFGFLFLFQIGWSGHRSSGRNTKVKI